MTQPAQPEPASSGPNLRSIFAVAFELAGLAVLTVGLWWLFPWLAMVALGLGLLVIGQAIEGPRLQAPMPQIMVEPEQKPRAKRRVVDPSEPPPPGLDWRPQAV